jgi:hypothetical protein
MGQELAGGRLSRGNVRERILDRGHPRADAEPIDSAFHRVHALFEQRVRRIADPGLDVSFDFQVE